MTRITVPFLDANILDVTVVKWHKSTGDAVSEGEVVAEVSSDKAAYEIESPASGTLLVILAPEKSIVPVKTILGVVGAPGEADDAATAENARILSEYHVMIAGPTLRDGSSRSRTGTGHPLNEASVVGTATSMHPGVADGAPLRATPKARRLAEARGIDLAEVAKANGGVSMVTEKMVADFIATS